MKPEHDHANCYCHTCQRWFHHRGIASHRAVHRRREEECKIRYSTGKTYIHMFDAQRNAREAQAAA